MKLMLPPATFTAAVVRELATLPAFKPTSPPIMLLLAPSTEPVTVMPLMVPKFAPTRPPTIILAPSPVTLPVASDDPVI